MIEFQPSDAAALDQRRITAVVDATRPLLTGVDLDHRPDEWVGSRPCTADGFPLIGVTADQASTSPAVVACGASSSGRSPESCWPNASRAESPQLSWWHSILSVDLHPATATTLSTEFTGGHRRQHCVSQHLQSSLHLDDDLPVHPSPQTHGDPGSGPSPSLPHFASPSSDRLSAAGSAQAVAMIALPTPRLNELTYDEELVPLRLLSDRRDELSQKQRGQNPTVGDSAAPAHRGRVQRPSPSAFTARAPWHRDHSSRDVRRLRSARRRV